MFTPVKSRARLALAIVCMSAAIASESAAAPSAQLRVARGPYYVTVPVDLQVQVTGLERAPEPECRAEAPSDSALSLISIVPQISTSMQIINGRMSRSETVTFVCHYRFIASSPGTYRIPPFEVAQGGQVVRSSPYSLDVVAVPLDPSLRVRIAMPSDSVYIGQQIPVRIEWWLDAELADRVRTYTIRSPLFDDPDTFRFLEDEPPLRGEQSLELDTAKGQIALEAEVSRRRADGREYIVITGERRLVPLRAGEFELGPATVNVDEVTRWQRDLFGSRRPAGTRRLFGRDRPLTLRVDAAPSEGRPESFGGAIGRGFTLDVTADRSVVQEGDPITLTLTVRGDGHFSTVGPPRLDGEQGLPTDHFRLTEGDVSGRLLEDGKTFEVPVRVLSEEVREIPAIEYAWFDPDLGSYQTTRSRPIALSVRPAEIISAGDVVATRRDGGEPGPSGDDAPAGSQAIDHGELIASGADLSIERRADRLRVRRGAALPIRIAFYSAGCAALAASLFWRRRKARSPRSVELTALHRKQRQRIERAADLARPEALAEIAAALREFAAADPALRSDEVDRFVRECDEVVYAPAAGSGTAIETERIERARALLDQLAERIE